MEIYIVFSEDCQFITDPTYWRVYITPGKSFHVLNDLSTWFFWIRAEDSGQVNVLLLHPRLGASAGVGCYMSSLNGAVLAAAANVLDFSFVLPSAIFGSMAGKAIPLGACNASSFYIELELETLTNMFAYTTGAAALTAVSVI